MQLKTFVKVGNISNLSDARYCAGFGVNMLGFNLDKNDSESIDTQTAREIMGWVSVDDFLLECGQMNIEEILAINNEFELKTVQVDSQGVASQVINNGLEAILRINIESDKDIDSISKLDDNQGLKYIVLESPSNTLSAQIEEKLKSINLTTPILKSFDIDVEKVLSVASSPMYGGIALKGQKEEQPGFKTYDELADILELLEEEY